MRGGFYAGASPRRQLKTAEGIDLFLFRTTFGVRNRKCRAKPRFSRDLISSPRMTALFGDCPVRDRER